MPFLIAAAIFTGVSVYQSTQAASEQREARRAQSRGEQFKAKRERIKQVREALVRQSKIENQAASQGVGGASGAMSGVGSVASQAATNISDIGSQLSIGRTVSRGYGRAQAYSNRANMFSQLSSVALAGHDLNKQYNFFGGTGGGGGGASGGGSGGSGGGGGG